MRRYQLTEGSVCSRGMCKASLQITSAKNAAWGNNPISFAFLPTGTNFRYREEASLGDREKEVRATRDRDHREIGTIVMRNASKDGSDLLL